MPLYHLRARKDRRRENVSEVLAQSDSIYERARYISRTWFDVLLGCLITYAFAICRVWVCYIGETQLPHTVYVTSVCMNRFRSYDCHNELVHFISYTKWHLQRRWGSGQPEKKPFHILPGHIWTITTCISAQHAFAHFNFSPVEQATKNGTDNWKKIT